MFATMGEMALVLHSRQEPTPAQPDLHHRPLVRLYCLNGGHHLRILPDGTVGGGRLEQDIYDTLRLKAVSPGVVVIRGEASGRYLAMDQDGRLYGSQVVEDECYFLETYEENHYNTYGCRGRPGWYVGLKRSGEPKWGPKTQHHQKAVCFLPRPVRSL
ncbi:hypothetical protein NHX12_010470 [Muraenolepis orangiensis]|uniref:Fibroblast growth factor n=1 Tax=Muraenolepis orangiensis TaxID=630683 RepID=A0A9Q0DJT4_9TELE|nr:hypothetical protein NHX12_010470 [Muraenolepis orangiensis]